MSTSFPSPDSSLSQKALLEENRRLKASVTYLKEEIAELKRLIFGSKSERFVPAQKDDTQLSLELAAETSDEEQAVVKQTVSYQRAVKQVGEKPIRQNYPDHMPLIVVAIEPEEDVSPMPKMGE